MSILFTPFQFCVNGLGFSIFMSLVIFIIGFMGLLKTNNPSSRFNIFTLNKNYKNTMENSMYKDPTQIFKLDKPSDDEVKRINRNKKINQILK